MARAAPIVADLCSRYLSEHAGSRKKASSADEDRRMVESFVLPVLRNRKVADVTRADIVKLRPDGLNTCRHVERFKETKRDRYLSADELARLGDVLAERELTATEAPNVIAAVRLLILTGCRLSEILTLQWEHIDFAGACLRLPDSKTEAKTVHLNAPALAVLSAVERKDASPWVIVGEKPGAHLVNCRSRGDVSGSSNRVSRGCRRPGLQGSRSAGERAHRNTSAPRMARPCRAPSRAGVPVAQDV